MEVRVLNNTLNFTYSSTNLPEVTQTDLYGPMWRQVYLAGVSIVATAANLIVIACLWRDPSSEISGFSTYAISMAFADLLVGVVLMPLNLIPTLFPKWKVGVTGCILWSLADYGLTSVSMLLFLAMGYDRYRCVAAPLQYRSEFRTTRITRICVFVWIAGFVLWTPYTLLKILLYEQESFTTNCPAFTFRANVFDVIQITVVYYIPLLALVVINGVLIWKLNTRISRSKTQRPTGSSKQMATNISTVSGMIGHHDRTSRKPVTSVSVMTVSREHASEKKSCRMTSRYKIAVLLVVYCVCWLPFFISWPVSGLCGTCLWDLFRDICGLFTYGQSAINPLIVICTSLQIRSKIARACVVLSRRK